MNAKEPPEVKFFFFLFYAKIFFYFFYKINISFKKYYLKIEIFNTKEFYIKKKLGCK